MKITNTIKRNSTRLVIRMKIDTSAHKAGDIITLTKHEYNGWTDGIYTYLVSMLHNPEICEILEQSDTIPQDGLLAHLKEDDTNITQYTAWNGRTCYRTFAPFAYYAMLCAQYGLKIEWVTDGYSATAHGNGFDLDWVEHDLIYAEHTLAEAV